MNDKRHSILFVSLIFPLLALLFFDLFCLLMVCASGFDSLLYPYIFAGISGFIGFYGFTLLASNRFIREKLRTIICLSLGVIACLITTNFLEIEFDYLFFNTFNSFSDFMLMYFLFWPNFVALYFIIFLSIKLAIEKASN